MDSSEWIALGALGVSILVAFRGEMNLRGERRTRAREDERRDEEIRLLRAQVEGQAEDRVSERRAELVVRQGDRGGESGGADYYSIIIVNGGRATAHDVRAWIAGEQGQQLSDDVQRPGSILPNDTSPTFKLRLNHQYSRDRSIRLFLRAAWADGTGDREENLGELDHV
jgi:hypothetical protein